MPYFVFPVARTTTESRPNLALKLESTSHKQKAAMFTDIVAIWDDIVMFADPLLNRNSKEVCSCGSLVPEAEMIPA